MSMLPSELVVGIAWYRPGSYERVVALMADGASFPKTHASWRQKAGRMEREIQRQGSRTVRIEIEPEVFLPWCEGRGLAPDSSARAVYVSEEARAREEGPAT